MFKVKNCFKIFFAFFFCLTLFLVPITVYAQEGIDVPSDEISNTVLVDGCNMFTDKEEVLIRQAQKDVYDELGVHVDIYGYTDNQIINDISTKYSPISIYTFWADKHAIPGNVTVLYASDSDTDDIANGSEGIWGRVRYNNVSGNGPNVGDIFCDIFTLREYALYRNNTSYVGFDVYYILEHDVLRKNEEVILETWSNETEGNISPDFISENTTVETTTETIAENSEIINTTPSHSIGDFLFLFIGVGIGLLCAIGGRVLSNYNDDKVAEIINEKTPETNSLQEQTEKTQVKKLKKVSDELTPEEKILQRDYNRFVGQFERFKEFAKNEGIPESKLSPFTMKNGVLEQIQDGIKHYHNIRIMSGAHDEDAKAIYAAINKNIQNGYEAIDIMKEHAEQFRSLEIQNSEKALKVVLEQRGMG